MSEKKEKNDKKPKDNKETSDKKQSTKSGNSKDPLTIKEKVSLLTSDSIEYAFARGGGVSAEPKDTPSPSLRRPSAAQGAAAADDISVTSEDDRFWGQNAGGLQFGYSSPQGPYHHGSPMAPQGPYTHGPPQATYGYPGPLSYDQMPAPMAFPQGYYPPAPMYGGWQLPQQAPVPGPVPYQLPQQVAARPASRSSSPDRGSELEEEDEEVEHAPSREADPTDDLRYLFEETPLTVVHARVAEIMTQALGETSTRNYASLLTKCGEFTFPANVKAQVPVLDHKVIRSSKTVPPW